MLKQAHVSRALVQMKVLERLEHLLFLYFIDRKNVDCFRLILYQHDLRSCKTIKLLWISSKIQSDSRNKSKSFDFNASLIVVIWQYMKCITNQ